MVEAIRAAGGEVYGITSEPQALASRAQEDWQLSFQCVGDPHQEIANLARENGTLDLGVAESNEFISRDTAFEISHPKGFYQPGVLALSAERILYRWQSIPTRENIGGAAGRPSESYVWKKIQGALGDDSSVDIDLDESTFINDKGPPFVLFVILLMANGWFLRPRAFTYQGDGIDPMRRIPKMMGRVAIFVACWITAFALLPLPWVMSTLALYLIIAVRGIRKVYATFANEVRG